MMDKPVSPVEVEPGPVSLKPLDLASASPETPSPGPGETAPANPGPGEGESASPTPADRQEPGLLPDLVLQMQRMGDILLSFPLFCWMRRGTPARPIWVVAEPVFFEPLMHLSPPVVYAAWTGAEELGGQAINVLLNLSHRPEAAGFAARMHSCLRLGPVRDAAGITRINGPWQLYRASLIHNNRHNRFHWAELNALDCVDNGQFSSTHFDQPRTPAEGNVSVGVFIGASQDEKRPQPDFWAALCDELIRRGLRPVLLGGPGDIGLGAQVGQSLAGQSGGILNLCGTLGLRELAAVGQTLALMITPDTGPMHLAAWTGLQVLNLSMGPVSPWETGPFMPGHYVLRAGISCLDCWECRQPRLLCRDRFDPAQVAYLAWRMVKGSARLKAPPGMRLYRTGRTAEGFYMLERQGARASTAPDILGELWRGVFGMFFGLWGPQRPAAAWADLQAAFPRLALAFRRAALELAGSMSRALALGLDHLDDAFWQGAPSMIRPVAGFMHMRLQNGDFSLDTWRECLAYMERLLPLLTDGTAAEAPSIPPR